MTVVLLGGSLDLDLQIPDVLKKAGAIPFPKVPDPIFLGDGSIQHVTVAPQNLPRLHEAAKKAGMYVLIDRFALQRQGPLQPGRTFTV